MIVCEPTLARRALVDSAGLVRHQSFWQLHESSFPRPLHRALNQWIRGAADADDVERSAADAVDRIAQSRGDLLRECVRAVLFAHRRILALEEVPELADVVREYVETEFYPQMIGRAGASHARRVAELQAKAAGVLARHDDHPAVPDVLVRDLDIAAAGRLYLRAVVASLGGTAVALSWLICALYADELVAAERAYASVDAVSPDSIALETLRLWPPTWQHRREVERDHQIGPVTARRGDHIVVPVFALHRHSAYWPRATSFDPHRWTGLRPDAFLPFAAGPGACVGAAFELRWLAAAAARLRSGPPLSLTRTGRTPIVTAALAPPPHELS